MSLMIMIQAEEVFDLCYNRKTKVYKISRLYESIRILSTFPLPDPWLET